MLNTSQKQFLLLCEAIVNEDSNIPKVIGRGVAAMALTKHIHSKMNKAHTMDIEPVREIDLALIKKYGGFYIIQGDAGYVAIIGGRYGMTVAGVKKGNQEVATSKIELIPPLRKFIKEYAGKLEKYWKSGGSAKDSTTNLKNKRAELKTVNRAEVSADSLFERFRPLFVKAGQAAIADIRGVAANMLKSGNYSDLAAKIDRLKKLEDNVSFLEGTGGKLDATDPNDRYKQQYAKEFFKNALTRAVELTAHYFSGAEIDPTSKVDSNWESEEKLFSDIQNGDTKKLSALLTYFKNGLLR